MSEQLLQDDDPQYGTGVTERPQPSVDGEIPRAGDHQPGPDGTVSRAPVRVCRRCSTQSVTEGNFCPQCGASFSRRGLKRRTKILMGLCLLILIVGGGAAAAIAKINHDNKVAAAKRHEALVAKRAAEEAAAARLAAAQAAATQQQQQQAQNAIQVSMRQDLVNALQRSITKDAQKDVSSGLLNGPAITKTDCTPVGGGNLQDTLADHTGNWSCLAVNQTNADGTESGYGFSATINYDTGEYTWHLGSGSQ